MSEISEATETIEETEQPPKSRVTRISIGRVHNLGNYENIRYEVTVEVAPGEKVSELISNLETAVEDIRATSSNSSYEINRAKKFLATPVEELDEFDAARLNNYKKIVADHEEALAKRQRAKDSLNLLGVSTEYKDAKLEWDDDDDY